MEPVYDALIERLDLRVLIASRLGIDVSDIAVRCIQFMSTFWALLRLCAKRPAATSNTKERAA